MAWKKLTELPKGLSPTNILAWEAYEDADSRYPKVVVLAHRSLGGSDSSIRVYFRVKKSEAHSWVEDELPLGLMENFSYFFMRLAQ